MEITRQQFLEQRHRRFGRTNPQRMHVPFWGMMVRTGKGAYWARQHFNETYDEHTAPVWCFDRFGMSQTTLPDGRTVCVAGEHEDHYDPDFCIYNDVVVRHADGPDAAVEVFGYPREVFPPTDFHSATLLGDRVLLIGSLGYPDDRRPGHTPVYALSLSDFRITEVATSGEAPGWISRHEATARADGRITVAAGAVEVARGGKRALRKNLEEFELDPASGRWRQITAGNWRQFSIRPERWTFRQRMRGWSVKRLCEMLSPAVSPHAVVVPVEERGRAVLRVEGVDVSLTDDYYLLRVVVEGRLPDGVVARLVELVRAKAEEWLQGRCELEEW